MQQLQRTFRKSIQSCPDHTADLAACVHHGFHLNSSLVCQYLCFLKQDIPPRCLHQDFVSKDMHTMSSFIFHYFRNVFKFAYLTLPCSLISWICFVSSQRKEGFADADTCCFAIFHLLSALSILYIVIYPKESRWFETCRRRRVGDQIIEKYEMTIRGM